MNVFADLARPITNRPGMPVDREKYRLLATPDSALTPDQLAKRKAARRRPNAALPAVDNPWGLTPVQAAVVAGIAAGEENAAIADRLDISRKTVEVHIQNAKARMAAVECHEISRVRMAVLFDRFLRERRQEKEAA